jgi:hypothetical protein
VANFCAIIGMLATMYIPVKAYNIIFRTQDLNAEDFKKRYKTIISGLKTDGPLSYQFICVFFFRRALFATLFVIFQSNPTLQITFALFTTISMLLYLSIVRPYDTYLSNILGVTNEILLCFMLIGTSQFLDPIMTPDQSKMIGNAFIGIIVGTIVVNWGGIISYGKFLK